MAHQGGIAGLGSGPEAECAALERLAHIGLGRCGRADAVRDHLGDGLRRDGIGGPLDPNVDIFVPARVNVIDTRWIAALRAAARRTDQRSSTTSTARRRRPSGINGASAWNTKTSGSKMRVW